MIPSHLASLTSGSPPAELADLHVQASDPEGVVALIGPDKKNAGDSGELGKWRIA